MSVYVISKEEILKNLVELKSSTQSGVEHKIHALVDCYLRQVAEMTQWEKISQDEVVESPFQNTKYLNVSLEGNTALMELVRTMEKNGDYQIKLIRNYMDRLEALKQKMEDSPIEEIKKETQEPLLPQLTSKSSDCECCTIS